MLLLLLLIGLIVWISEKFGTEAGGIAFLVILVFTIILVVHDSRKDIEAYYNWRDYWLTGGKRMKRKMEAERIAEAERVARRAERELREMERKGRHADRVIAEMQAANRVTESWFACPNCGTVMQTLSKRVIRNGVQMSEYVCRECGHRELLKN